jgi:hypothetical protein
MRSQAASERSAAETFRQAPQRDPGQPAVPGAAAVLAFQRAAGNRAVARMLASRERSSRPKRAVARCGHCQGTCRCGHAATEGEELPNPLVAAVSARVARFSSSSPSQGSSSGSSQPGGSSAPGGSSESSQSDSSAGEAPAPATGSGLAPDPSRCRVDVRATHIGGALSGAPIWHLVIVHTDASGVQTGWRGGPGGGSPTSGFGTIIGTTGAYAPGFVDYDTSSPSITVDSGAGVCGKTTCFASELARIDGTATPYSPTGPNSNTWVKTVLSNCSLPVRKPVWIAPGFGDPNL